MGYTPSWEKLPQVIEARRLGNEVDEARRLASAHIAASRIQHYAILALREREENHRAVEKMMHAQRSATDPTPDDRLVEVAEEIVDQLVQQKPNGIQAQQGKLVELWIKVMVQLELQQQRQQQRQQEEKGNSNRRRRPSQSREDIMKKSRKMRISS